MKEKKINKDNWKEFNHIGVGAEAKTKFENLRFELIGRLGKKITQEQLLNILMDYFKNEKQK